MSYFASFFSSYSYYCSFSLSLVFLFILLWFSSLVEYEIWHSSNLQSINVLKVDSTTSFKYKSNQHSSSHASLEDQKYVRYSSSINSVSLSNVQAPRLLSHLPKKYPEMAKEANIEATLLLEIFINTDGTVGKVNILDTHLSRILPDLLNRKFKRLFQKATYETLHYAKYSRPYVNNRNVPIKFKTSLQFILR